MSKQKLEHKKLKLSPFEIILEPVLTEKAILMNKGNFKKYVFKVHKDASKDDIKNAMEQVFNVKVQKVNTINIPERTKYFRYRHKYNRTSYKKAIVTLKEGYSIDIIDKSIEKEK